MQAEEADVRALARLRVDDGGERVLEEELGLRPVGRRRGEFGRRNVYELGRVQVIAVLRVLRRRYREARFQRAAQGRGREPDADAVILRATWCLLAEFDDHASRVVRVFP